MRGRGVVTRMLYPRSAAAAGPSYRVTLNARAASADPPRQPDRRGGKFGELDGLRGVASLVVVAWHFVYAFLPQRIGIVPPFDPAAGLAGSPLLVLLNGPGAVMLFFVLSGYVLPLGYFRSGRTGAVVRAVAKRWFRLAGLTLLAAVVSYLLFRFGLYRYREAAAVTGSGWLGSFGGGDVNGGLRPSLAGAVLEGTVFAFVRSADAYNPVFWTMRDELFGSVMVFGLALLLVRCRVLTGAALLVLAVAATQFVDPRLAAFVAGLALSRANACGMIRVGRWLAPVCLVAGLALFGYLEPRGAYAWLGFLHDGSAWRYDRIWLHTAGGVLLILGVLGSQRAGLLLASGAGRLLGRLSFPVYLFHFPLMCSLS